MVHQLLQAELGYEGQRVRATLARVPAAHADYRPHPKSTPLGKLAAHLAQLGGFGLMILTQPELDFATAGMSPLAFQSPQQVVAAFDAGLAPVEAALARTADSAWNDPWKLCHGSQVFFQGTRFTAYRAMFLNHLVHHRAQLGVYLRLLDVPVPSVYGPSADEH